MDFHGILASIVNLGGTGALAAALLWLHRESLATFREELRAGRDTFREEMAAERRMWNEALITWRAEKLGYHGDLTERLDRIESMVEGLSNRKRTTP
ncbi:MAG: hypothetical protein ACRC33_22680 [Gemmataceae bacterium]